MFQLDRPPPRKIVSTEKVNDSLNGVRASYVIEKSAPAVQWRSQVFGGRGVHENPDLPEAFHERRMHEFANLD